MNKGFKQAWLLCLAAFFQTTLFAQQDSISATDTGVLARPGMFDNFHSFYTHPLRNHFEGSLLMADAGIMYSSNAAVTKLAYNFYLQRPLSGEDIRTSVGKMSETNIGGREVNMGVQYVFPVKNRYNNFFYVGYRYRRHQSARFSDEFGKFYFQGNKQFAGDTINGNDTRYLDIRYDALHFGWMKYFTINGMAANISVGVGLVRGFNYRSIVADKLLIFTEENGDYIDVQLSMKAKRTPPYKYNFFKPVGYGAMADVKFNLALTAKSGISFEATDIGFMSWNKNSATFERKDTTVRFDGVFVLHPDSLRSESYAQQIGDSLVNQFKIPYSVNTFSSMLPARIRLSYFMGLTPKNHINIRMQLMAYTSFRPQLCIESLNFISSKLYSVTGVSLGGFGPLDIYQNVGWQVNKRYFAGIGLFGIEGIILPRTQAGFGANFSIAARL